MSADANTTLLFNVFRDKNCYMSPINLADINYNGETYTSVIQFMAMIKASYLCDYEEAERIVLGTLNVDQMTRYFITKSNVPDVALTRWRIFSKYSMFNILTHKFKGDDELRTTLMSTGKNTLKCSDPSLYGQKGVDHIVPMNDSMIKEHCDDLSEVMMAIREQFDYEFTQSYAHM